jgi:hypothetical protein
MRREMVQQVRSPLKIQNVPVLFPHTVTQKLAKARTYPPLQNRLLSHAIGPSVEERTYMGSLEFSVKELQEVLEKITFPMV